MIEDKNNTEFDLMMRSILENGREEVPAHIWDAVSDGLDTALKQKKAALWWRRAAASCSIAAALAAGLFFAFRNGAEPDSANGMIAVVSETDTQDNETCREKLLAELTDAASPSEKAASVRIETVIPAASAADLIQQTDEYPADSSMIQETGETDRTADDIPAYNENQENNSSGNKDKAGHTATGDWTDWPEDDTNNAGRIKSSFVVSGITGTNSTRSLVKKNLMKRPTVPSDKPKTGITETSTNATYGMPISFGTGVKIDFTKRWSLGTGLNYTILTRKFYGNYTKANSEGEVEYSQSSDIRNIQHYVGIPLNVYFNIVDNRYINFYAYSGGTVEKCVADKYEILSITGSRPTHRETVKGVQLSADIGIGAEFMIGKHVGIYVDPSLRYYFDNGQPKSIRTAQPLMLGFEMGIRARM